MSETAHPLRSVVFILQPERLETGPGVTGPMVHAALFRGLLGRFRPDLATQLHPGKGMPSEARASGPPSDGMRSRELQPFTLSTCWNTGGLLRLRMTSLSAPLSEWLADLDLETVGRLTIGDTPFRAVAILSDATQDPWAGSTSWAALALRWKAQRRFPPGFRLDFASPTTFRKASGERRWNVLFPAEEEVLRSLADKWRRFAPPALRLPSGIEASGLVMAARYRLRSEYLSHWPYPQKAFLGWCEYRVDHRAPSAVVRAIHMLIEFAFYAGVGAMTTMGLGQVRPRPWPPAPRHAYRRAIAAVEE